MGSTKVAFVSSDPLVRRAAAEAFDRAPAGWSMTLHDSPPVGAGVVVFGPDAAPPGATSFDPADPDSLLRTVEAARAAGTAPALVLCGAVGGAGVTSLAIHLAAELGRTAPTCLVDLAKGGVAARLDLAEVVAEDDALASDETLMLRAQPTAGGFRLLQAPAAVADRLVARARRRFDHVVVDAGRSCAGTGTPVLVLPPTVPAACRAAVLVRGWSGGPGAVVVNRLGPGGETGRAVVERIVERKVAIELPCSPALRDAEDTGRLLTSRWSPWRVKVGWLARALAQR